MKPLIAISLSPNTEKDDVLIALRHLFSPWLYVHGAAVKKLELWLRNFYGVSHAILFASGRGALFSALKAAEVGKGDEVLLQAFTCVAVPNAVIATGAVPIYVDCSNDFTIDPIDFEKKITKNTKVIIVQHTFGIPADMDPIKKIAKKHHIVIIEDCAHGIGIEYKNKKLGTLGDMAILSFGRDKAFSSVFGGAVITDNQNFGKKIRGFQKQQTYPGVFWIIQQILHPVLFVIVLRLYTFFSLGKILLVIFQKLHLLSFPVTDAEKMGKSEKFTVLRLPNSLSEMALHQLKKQERYNEKRKKFAGIYIKELKNPALTVSLSQPIAFLRFPVLFARRDDLLEYLRKRNIYAGKWFSEIIDPKDTDIRKVGYRKGSCDLAEKLSAEILNLPLYPAMTERQVRQVASLINAYAAD